MNIRKITEIERTFGEIAEKEPCIFKTHTGKGNSPENAVVQLCPTKAYVFDAFDSREILEALRNVVSPPPLRFRCFFKGIKLESVHPIETIIMTNKINPVKMMSNLS